MKMSSFLFALLLLASSPLFSQVAVNTDGTAPDNSAMLDVKSTTKGVLLPRLTLTQIAAIAIPANGLQVFCTTDGKMYLFVAASNLWKEVAYGTGTITPLTSCGNSFTIVHTAGNVAPVNKTVTYATVTGIPGEPAKCWITSNLGSDHQATAVDDATEESAGWYWQFNLKQGYKHDGTTLTPAWTITSINDDSDWTSSNDPCTLELGTGWRIPTTTEWTNVDASGNWINWNGVFGSALKLHAAGSLFPSNGSIAARGVAGEHWGSTQYNTTDGSSTNFGFEYSYIYNFNKAYGFSLRCIKEN